MGRRGLAAAIAAIVVIGLAVLLVRARSRTPGPSAPPASAPPVSPTPETGTANPPAPTKPAPPPTVRRDGGAGAVAVTLRAAWGSGPGQLGRRADPESVTEGPMSFIVDGSGVTVLDNVNQRLARFDPKGRARPPIALPNAAAQDVARGAGERMAVLDRLRDGRVTLYDGDGRVLGGAPLVGRGVAEPAAVTGIFADRDGRIIGEREHRAWVQLLDAAGAADPTRPPAPGRPTRDGGFVTAAIADRGAGTVTVHRFDGDGRPRWDAVVAFGAPVMFLALVDADAAGDVFVGVHTGRESAAPPYTVVDETLRVAALDGSGRSLASTLSVPAPPPHEEAFRDLYVGDDGTIYWMRRTPAGVVLEAYRL